MTFTFFTTYTAVLCLLGWMLHWLFDWGVYNKAHGAKGFFDFIDDDLSAFWVSILGTIVLYMLGPDVLRHLLRFFGVEFPPAFDDAAVKGIFAFGAGFFGDWIVTKFSELRTKK